MEYNVIHLSEYNPKTDMYEREEHFQFCAACIEYYGLYYPINKEN